MGFSLLGAACQAGANAGTLPSASPKAPASAAQLHITPANGSRDAKPGEGISVTVADGTIAGATVRTTGEPVSGQLGAGDTAWHSRWALNTDTRYTVRATGQVLNLL